MSLWKHRIEKTVSRTQPRKTEDRKQRELQIASLPYWEHWPLLGALAQTPSPLQTHLADPA